MISSLTGKINLTKENFIILDVAGVGYKIFVGAKALDLKEGQSISLYTYLAVRENSMELFGFLTFIDLQLFELLISISGIGPKVGLSIMDLTTPESLKRAVISEQTDELIKVSGIGKKIAQKIILELKNKIEKIDIASTEDSDDIEIYETLEALGFDRYEIRKTLSKLKSKNTDEKIKEALRVLGK